MAHQLSGTALAAAVPFQSNSLLKELFDKGAYSDVTVRCSGRDFACHTAIIASRSNYFAGQMKSREGGNLKDPKKMPPYTITIPGCSAIEMEVILRYLYMDAIDATYLQDNVQKKLPLLYAAAEDKIHLEPLKKEVLIRLAEVWQTQPHLIPNFVVFYIEQLARTNLHLRFSTFKALIQMAPGIAADLITHKNDSIAPTAVGGWFGHLHTDLLSATQLSPASPPVVAAVPAPIIRTAPVLLRAPPIQRASIIPAIMQANQILAAANGTALKRPADSSDSPERQPAKRIKQEYDDLIMTSPKSPKARAPQSDPQPESVSQSKSQSPAGSTAMPDSTVHPARWANFASTVEVAENERPGTEIEGGAVEEGEIA